jgi:hypothetical protein
MTAHLLTRPARAVAIELHALCKRQWLRCKLAWAEADAKNCEQRIALAEAEAAFLPSQLQVYQDTAADLRTQLVALGRGL